MRSIGVEALLKAILGTPRGKSFHIGSIPPHVLEELAGINAAYTRPEVRTTTHAAEQRMIKQGWTPETTAKAFDELLQSGDFLRGMPNKPGGDRAAQEALWLPGKPISLFAPTVPLRDGGVEIRTLHEDGFAKLMEVLESQADLWGGGKLPISSLHRNVSYGGTSSQQPRLSAVKGQPDFGLNLGDIFEQVKNGKRGGRMGVLAPLAPLGVGASAMTAAILGDAQEGEAAALPGFAKKYAEAVAKRQRGMLEAGTLEPEVFEQVRRRDPSVKNNKVLVGKHGGDARYATGEMDPLEVGQHIENLLNSRETSVLPNFPSKNIAPYRGKGMLYASKEKNVVSPFRSGIDGEVLLKTLFEPNAQNQAFIDRFLGGPKPSISGQQNNVSPSTQPQGLSVVRNQPTNETKLSDQFLDVNGLKGGVNKKSLMPWPLMGYGLSSASEAKASIPPATSFPPNNSMNTWQHKEHDTSVPSEPPLEEALWSPVDLLLAPLGVPGVGAKAAAMALSAPATWTFDKALEYAKGIKNPMPQAWF